ncbi:hypothetical protein TIFTF001_012200 [Ficus carica]|uniref:Uncharacterized protein n=1 Tax=Ficus carica TaxID=3494 RepID=A0AA88AMY9_FICCA|nr:hypothetical protein TIFTF001_012200 [Ficus carica]
MMKFLIFSPFHLLGPIKITGLLIGRLRLIGSTQQQSAQEPRTLSSLQTSGSRQFSDPVQVPERRRRSRRGRRGRIISVGEIYRLGAGALARFFREILRFAPANLTAIAASAAEAFCHEIAVGDCGSVGQGAREVGSGDHSSADVENTVESSGRSPDLEGGEGRDLGADVEEVADEESDGPDQRVADATDGVDLDVDAGGIAGEELRCDSEEEPVVPGRVLAADLVDAGAELGGGVDPNERVRAHAPRAVGGLLEALGGDQVDLQNRRRLSVFFRHHLPARSTVLT